VPLLLVRPLSRADAVVVALGAFGHAIGDLVWACHSRVRAFFFQPGLRCAPDDLHARLDTSADVVHPLDLVAATAFANQAALERLRCDERTDADSFTRSLYVSYLQLCGTAHTPARFTSSDLSAFRVHILVRTSATLLLYRCPIVNPESGILMVSSLSHVAA
jgi:hypothetical protein